MPRAINVARRTNEKRADAHRVPKLLLWTDSSSLARRTLQAEPLSFIGKVFDMARKRVVSFVAMLVDHQATLGSISQSSVTDRMLSDMVRSKCGMPPTMSTPGSRARMMGWRNFSVSAPRFSASGRTLQDP